MTAADARGATVAPEPLLAFAGHALATAGMDADDARVAAETMVWADIRGQHTHGIWYLPRYVAGLRGGGITPKAQVSIVSQTPATAVLDGDGGLGGLVAVRACELAAEKAAQVGCATVLVRNSNHFGAASFYSLYLAERDCIGIVTANSGPAMAAPGGIGRLLGTQPVSFATPDPDGDGPVMLDMALSVVAGTRVTQARADGESIPEGWVVDGAGRPTTNPADLWDGGALLPLAGHKGFGLAVLAEILSGVLSGAGVTGDVHSHHPTRPSDTGHCVIALHVPAFMDVEEFRRRLAALRAQVHDAPVAEGNPRAILPGEPEFAHAAAATTDGLQIDGVIWEAVAACADELGLRDELEAARA